MANTLTISEKRKRPTHEETIEQLKKYGLTLKPINRGPESIKDEPKWELVKIENE